jgi:hypothetical protein
MGHEAEQWFGLYRDAMVELRHAKMTGRIGETRTAITARVEKLRDMPGLHSEEYQAINDALSGLRLLEQEEAKYQAEEKGIAERAVDRLKILEPKFKRE